MATSIGILGGGQLGALLGKAALSLKHNPCVMVQSLDETAVSWGIPHELHSYYNPQGIRSFLEKMDVVVFENEFFPPALKDIAEGLEHKFRPSLSTLLQLQNKATQKILFSTLELPTAPFEIFTGDHFELKDWLQTRAAKNTPFVLKWAFGGYDGKGVLKFRALEEALQFCDAGLKKGAQVYAEDFVPYSLELAMVGARNARGEFCHFPLVCSKQENSICKWVSGPAAALGIARELEREAIHILKNFADHMGLLGTFAVEFFLAPGAKLLINEVAPRVHNSAHYTLDAADISQFALHIKACLDEHLSPPQVAPYFGMLNLIGNTYQAHPLAPQLKGDDYHLCWYDKKELKALRKTGHINTIAKSSEDLEQKLTALKRLDDSWLEQNLAKGKSV